ncbi:LURP-one-related/scramblase family protein [Halocalculus aciditolerans]|uniref:Uncharacterized protein n=1 Tax=Halocalculus aciditolerans TaxID=1383812 RepID=A0A830FAB0_9EURY|nr:hypothetical protein [Halocalculus aciditolerans]GGL69913.1 hypothetical protein GCM10009039_29920 [Halocalculus aciditolerans]
MTDYDIRALDLTDDEYLVTQSLVRNKYRAEDTRGNVVLRGKQKMFKLKEEFPFETGDGRPAFTVKAGGILDVAGNYALIDAQTDEPVLVLDQNWTFLTHKWKLRDPDTEALIATIESESKLVDALRAISDLFSVIPHKYEIRDADGDHVGRVAGQFSLADKYTVTIDDASDVPKEAVLAAAMVIDAIEGN